MIEGCNPSTMLSRRSGLGAKSAVAVLSLAVVVLTACTGGESRPSQSRQPLLAAGAEVDLIRVSEAVWAREAAFGVSGLSSAERTFLCVWNLESEVNNGGFHQFYINSAGDNALATPAALREIGATQFANIADQANGLFGPSGPPGDRGERTQALERLGQPATDALAALDARFYEYPENLQDLLKRFVDAKRDQFYRAP